MAAYNPVRNHRNFTSSSPPVAETPYYGYLLASVLAQPHALLGPLGTSDPSDVLAYQSRLPSGRLGTGADFYEHIASAFRTLYAESMRRPRMMTVSLHSRVSGQPARFEAAVRFLDLVAKHDHVWIAGRSEVARHWIANHPVKGRP